MIIVSAACFWMALGFLAWVLHDHDWKQRFGFDEKPAYWLLIPCGEFEIDRSRLRAPQPYRPPAIGTALGEASKDVGQI